STDLAWALVHEVQRLRAETEGGRTAMTTDPALVEQQADQDDARAVLDAITETHAVIELPEPDSTRYNEGEVAEFPPADRLGWLRGMVLYGVTFWPEYAGEVQVAYNNEPGEPLSVKEARTFAAALLAAARYAESGSTTPENKEG
ncbi:MAG TPA: hypothetical protein P5534_23675, partial [Candidatus Paceibacterota bacterium]|nr:hypothetical protein [Candidatus Paceibacterota bacterium]